MLKFNASTGEKLTDITNVDPQFFEEFMPKWTEFLSVSIREFFDDMDKNDGKVSLDGLVERFCETFTTQQEQNVALLQFIASMHSTFHLKYENKQMKKVIMLGAMLGGGKGLAGMLAQTMAESMISDEDSKDDSKDSKDFI